MTLDPELFVRCVECDEQHLDAMCNTCEHCSLEVCRGCRPAHDCKEWKE